VKTVRCGECGVTFGLSERNEYEHRRRGTQPRCRSCRCTATPLPTAPYRRWWVERLGLEEARAVAHMIWPRDATSTPQRPRDALDGTRVAMQSDAPQSL
jgi:hypothetical protein